jgi:hypothetical protein
MSNEMSAAVLIRLTLNPDCADAESRGHADMDRVLTGDAAAEIVSSHEWIQHMHWHQIGFQGG